MRRIVLKVGSHVLTHNSTIAEDRMSKLVRLIAQLKSLGNEVILVSSGAVAAGYTKLALDRTVLANKQALAGIGQPLLLKMYQEEFEKFDYLCSQVLLGIGVFHSEKYTEHAKVAIDTLLENNVVPIINENDTVYTEELVFGDNDRLSAYVAHYFDAELLVILSDIDAYYDKDPNTCDDAIRRSRVDSISEKELNAAHTPNNLFATGGIVTKLQAADFLMQHNRKMFLASGFDLTDVQSYLVEEKHEGGTLFQK